MTETSLFSPLIIYYYIASDRPIDEDSNLNPAFGDDGDFTLRLDP